MEPTLLYKIYKHLVQSHLDSRPPVLMPISHVIPKRWWTAGVQYFRVQIHTPSVNHDHPAFQASFFIIFFYFFVTL